MGAGARGGARGAGRGVAARGIAARAPVRTRAQAGGGGAQGPYGLLRGQEVVRGSDLATVELTGEWEAGQGETAVVAFARSFG